MQSMKFSIQVKGEGGGEGGVKVEREYGTSPAKGGRYVYRKKEKGRRNGLGFCRPKTQKVTRLLSSGVKEKKGYRNVN